MVSERCRFLRWRLCPKSIYNLVGWTVIFYFIKIMNLFSLHSIMILLLWFGFSLLAAIQSSTVKNCHPGCHCDVESFGLFDSFSLTRVDCRGLGPRTSMPIPIPLDTAHLDISSNAMGPLSDKMLVGPGYTTLISLDLSSNHITKVSCSKTFRVDP